MLGPWDSLELLISFERGCHHTCKVTEVTSLVFSLGAAQFSLHSIRSEARFALDEANFVLLAHVVELILKFLKGELIHVAKQRYQGRDTTIFV